MVIVVAPSTASHVADHRESVHHATLPFSYFPSFYAQKGNSPAMSLIVLGAILIACLAFIGFTVQSVVAGASARDPTRRYAGGARAGPAELRAHYLSGLGKCRAEREPVRCRDSADPASRDAGQTDLTVPPFRRIWVSSSLPTLATTGSTCASRATSVRSIATRSYADVPKRWRPMLDPELDYFEVAVNQA
jgi:hypothetical protein